MGVLKRLSRGILNLIVAFGISYGSSTAKELSVLDPQGNLIKVEEIEVTRGISEDKPENEFCQGSYGLPLKGIEDTDFIIAKYNPQNEIVWKTRYSPFVYSKDLAYVLISYAHLVPDTDSKIKDELLEYLKQLGIQPKITGEKREICHLRYRGECVNSWIEDNREIYPVPIFEALVSNDHPMALTVDGSGNIYIGVISEINKRVVPEECYSKLPKNGIFLDDPKRNKVSPSELSKIVNLVKDLEKNKNILFRGSVLKYTKAGELEKVLYLDILPTDVKVFGKYLYISGGTCLEKYDLNLNKIWEAVNKDHDSYLVVESGPIIYSPTAIALDESENVYIVSSIEKTSLDLPKEIYDCGPNCTMQCGSDKTSVLLISKYSKNGKKLWEKLYLPFDREIECYNLYPISASIDENGNLDVYAKATLDETPTLNESLSRKVLLKLNKFGKIIKKEFF